MTTRQSSLLAGASAIRDDKCKTTASPEEASACGSDVLSAECRLERSRRATDETSQGEAKISHGTHQPARRADLGSPLWWATRGGCSQRRRCRQKAAEILEKFSPKIEEGPSAGCPIVPGSTRPLQRSGVRRSRHELGARGTSAAGKRLRVT